MFINIKEDLITMKRKRFSRLLFLMLTIMITVTLYQPAQAASGKYIGTYTKTWSVSSNMTVTIRPSYSVIVNKVTSTKVRLQLEKLGVNGSPIYKFHHLQDIEDVFFSM